MKIMMISDTWEIIIPPILTVETIVGVEKVGCWFMELYEYVLPGKEP